MFILIFGLALFLGVHCVRIVAPNWRDRQLAQRGEKGWRGIYSLVSIAGLALIVWGYSRYFPEAPYIYATAGWARTIAYLAMPFALLLVMASNFPAGYIKRSVGHPMLVGTIMWAAAHLSSNGDLASVLLFGSFLVWAFLALLSARGRDNARPEKVKLWPDLLSVVLAFALTLALGAFAHEWLFGSPLI